MAHRAGRRNEKGLNEFEAFSTKTALDFGNAVIRICEEEYKRPVRIRVTYDDVIVYQYFCGELAGGEWLDRKEKTVKDTGKPTIYVYYHQDEYPDLVKDETQSPFGGGVPYIVNGVNHGAFIVSGLRHREDHDLVMKALEAIR